MRAVMRSLDPDLALADVHTMSNLESEAAARRRFQTTLLAAFATMAMLLATIGVYGLMAFSVRQRTGEIGLRWPLARHAVACEAGIREGLTLLATGLVLVWWAAGLSRLLTGFLYQVPAIDPVTYTLVSALVRRDGDGMSGSGCTGRRHRSHERTAARMSPSEAESVRLIPVGSATK